MLTVLQRVQNAHVEVENKTIGKINQGLLILCGFESNDDDLTLKKMLEKCLNYRIFSDGQGKMNKSLLQINGGLLLVPQFTLMAETSKGLRPSFSKGASPEKGKQLFTELYAIAASQHPHVAQGEFGANMQVHLCNDGPVTFLLQF